MFLYPFHKERGADIFFEEHLLLSASVFVLAETMIVRSRMDREDQGCLCIHSLILVNSLRLTGQSHNTVLSFTATAPCIIEPTWPQSVGVKHLSVCLCVLVKEIVSACVSNLTRALSHCLTASFIIMNKYSLIYLVDSFCFTRMINYPQLLQLPSLNTSI